MQQINLYLPEFRPNRDPLRAKHIGWGMGGLLILLGLFSVYDNYQNHQLEQRLANEKIALESLQLDLQKITLQQSARPTHQLDNEIQRLQQDVLRRQQILAIISNQDLGNATGFSGQLQAMARQSLEAIALESFSLQQGGNYVEFMGKTQQPDQVPLFLQRLRSESSFKEVRFGVINVERENPENLNLNFQVAKPAALKEGKK